MENEKTITTGGANPTSAGAPLIYPCLIAIMKDIKAIGKDKSDDDGLFSYRDIDDIYNALNPLFQKYGIFQTTEVLPGSKNLPEKTIIDARFTFWAEDGSSVASVVRGESNDAGDNGTSKALSKAHKAALTQMFLIPTAPAAAPADPKADTKKWMNAVQLKKALEYIETGEIKTLQYIEGRYHLKNTYKAKIMTAIKAKIGTKTPACSKGGVN